MVKLSNWSKQKWQPLPLHTFRLCTGFIEVWSADKGDFSTSATATIFVGKDPGVAAASVSLQAPHSSPHLSKPFVLAKNLYGESSETGLHAVCSHR